MRGNPAYVYETVAHGTLTDVCTQYGRERAIFVVFDLNRASSLLSTNLHLLRTWGGTEGYLLECVRGTPVSKTEKFYLFVIDTLLDQGFPLVDV